MPDSNERDMYVYLPSDLNRKERKERKGYSCLSILCALCALCGQFTSGAAQSFSAHATSDAAAGIVLNDPCHAGGVTYGRQTVPDLRNDRRRARPRTHVARTVAPQSCLTRIMPRTTISSEEKHEPKTCARDPR